MDSNSTKGATINLVMLPFLLPHEQLEPLSCRLLPLFLLHPQR